MATTSLDHPCSWPAGAIPSPVRLPCPPPPPTGGDIHSSRANRDIPNPRNRSPLLPLHQRVFPAPCPDCRQALPAVLEGSRPFPPSDVRCQSPNNVGRWFAHRIRPLEGPVGLCPNQPASQTHAPVSNSRAGYIVAKSAHLLLLRARRGVPKDEVES